MKEKPISKGEIQIENISITLLDRQQVQEEIIALVKKTKKSLVLSSNIHSMNIAAKSKWFFAFYQRAERVYCDGVGIQVAARILKLPIPVRMTPPDWFQEFCEKCALEDISFYFLGAKHGVTNVLASKLLANTPSLKIVGTNHGYFQKEKSSLENVVLINEINELKPDILVVGMGMPIQEKWIMENIEKLNAKVYLPVGAMFDYLIGEVKRGPRWMTDNGFEWLARLTIEPKRLWRRYIIGNPSFFYRVFKEKLKMIIIKGNKND